MFHKTRASNHILEAAPAQASMKQREPGAGLGLGPRVQSHTKRVSLGPHEAKMRICNIRHCYLPFTTAATFTIHSCSRGPPSCQGAPGRCLVCLCFRPARPGGEINSNSHSSPIVPSRPAQFTTWLFHH